MPRPRVTLKLATSLDGRIATAAGESRWITGDAARAEVHKMRSASDAVMIGAGTARQDDPELLARTDPPAQRQPLRVVLNSRLDLPASGRLFATLGEAPLLVIGVEDADGAALKTAGAEVARVSRRGAWVDVTSALALLAQRGVRAVLVEGGGQLAASLVLEGLVDRLEWFRAPLVLGEDGRSGIGDVEVDRLADAPRFKRVALRELGPDVWESYERA